jgi:small subunit ribosomal protein S11
MAKQQQTTQQSAVTKAKAKKRVVKVDAEGKVFVNATFNNIIVTFTNGTGQTISWGSAGRVGFRGSKKNTPYAAQMATSEAARVAHDAGLRKVEVFVKGPGAGRESAIRTIYTSGIEVTVINDMTPLLKREEYNFYSI